MKLVVVLSALLLSLSSFASDCKVYGISDSPQALSCTFAQRPVKLSCSQGQYLLNNELVSIAFHMEVEEGPTPLVFKSTTMQLTATKVSRGFLGTLEVNGKTLEGFCE